MTERPTPLPKTPGATAAPNTNVTGRRMAACLLDCLLVAILSLPVFVPLLLVEPRLVLVLLLLLLFVFLFCTVYLAYVAAFDGFRGRTLGKAIMGIEVIRAEDGGVPGPGRAALRAAMFLFVDMLAGVFVMLASPKRQRPGDMAANTIVVRKRGQRPRGGLNVRRAVTTPDLGNGKVRGVSDEEGASKMASQGRELLGEHYDDEHLTYEEINEIGLKVVTEKGDTVPNEELQGKIFRIADKDDASGYVVRSMEDPDAATVLCYLQAS